MWRCPAEALRRMLLSYSELLVWDPCSLLFCPLLTFSVIVAHPTVLVIPMEVQRLTDKPALDYAFRNVQFSHTNTTNTVLRALLRSVHTPVVGGSESCGCNSLVTCKLYQHCWSWSNDGRQRPLPTVFVQQDRRVLAVSTVNFYIVRWTVWGSLEIKSLKLQENLEKQKTHWIYCYTRGKIQITSLLWNKLETSIRFIIHVSLQFYCLYNRSIEFHLPSLLLCPITDISLLLILKKTRNLNWIKKLYSNVLWYYQKCYENCRDFLIRYITE